MTTVDTKYAQPSAVMLGRYEGSTIVSRAESFTVRYGETLSLRPVFCSSYATFQVQYRVSNRKNYASGLLDDPTGGEVWTDFPSWSDPSGATTTVAATVGGTAIRYASGLAISYSYDISSYDMHEVEIRARVFNSSADTCSEWAYGTVSICYCPNMTSYTATTEADGSVLFTFETNMPHRRARVNIVGGIDEDSGEKVVMWNQGVYANEGDVLRFPPELLVRRKAAIAGSVWTESAYMTSADGATLVVEKGADNGCGLLRKNGYEGFVIEPGAHTDPSDVPDPVIATGSATYEAVVVNITCQCASVVARAEYTDADGNAFSDLMEIGGSAPNWTATLPYPPYGVTITVKAACCNATGGYKLASATVQVVAAPHLSLDGEGDHVELVYEGEFRQSTRLDGESIATAGRKLPVSRHGVNVSRSFTARGTIAFPHVFSFGDMELAALNCLDNPHDWLYRTPAGYRKRVRVTGWGVDQSTEQLGRLADVSIDMEEVDG